MEPSRVRNESGLSINLWTDLESHVDITPAVAARKATVSLFCGGEKVGFIVVRRETMLELPTVTIEVDVKGEKSVRSWQSPLATHQSE